MNVKHVRSVVRRKHSCFVQRDCYGFAAPLKGMVCTGVIHKDEPHKPCSNAEEMRPVLPSRRLPVIHEAQPCLIDQCRGLECLVRTSPPQVAFGKRAEFPMHVPCKLFECGRIPFAPANE
jgi:hypothetical protein